MRHDIDLAYSVLTLKDVWDMFRQTGDIQDLVEEAFLRRLPATTLVQVNGTIKNVVSINNVGHGADVNFQIFIDFLPHEAYTDGPEE